MGTFKLTSGIARCYNRNHKSTELLYNDIHITMIHEQQ
jgi:hypothetical protein